MINNIIIGILVALPIPIPVHAEEVVSVPIPEEQTIEEKITETFNNPRMVDVLKCESQLRQFADGKPLISPTSDVGIAQINQVHWERAKSLNLDIFYSIDDNLAMAKIIYDEQSISAWTCNKLVS